MNPRDRLRSVGKRVTDPAEVLAQQVTERVVDLVMSALDINELAARVDVNALLSRIDLNAFVGRVDLNAVLARADLDAVVAKVDVNALLDRVDINALLDRVDVSVLLDRVDLNDLVGRVDMDALVQDTDLGAVMARSTGGVASEVLDAARSQAVGLDHFVDRWVRRLLRRTEPGPAVPPALLPRPAAATSAQAAP